MKVFGSISRLVSILFRKDSQDITLQPNQSTTYTASRAFELPPGDASHVIVSANSTQTLSNKTISGSNNTLSNISLTASVTGVLPTANGGTGQNSTATFPTSGVVVTEAATQTLTNKTIDADQNTISNIENADIKSGAAIDAAKLADGSVSNTEFQYLDGVTSAIQTQLDGKQALDADLTALAGLSTTGLIVRTGAGTAATRTLVAGTGISITNADGVSGDITINSTVTVNSFKANWATADGTSKTITHNLGSTDLIVQIHDTTTSQVIEVDTVVFTDSNTLDLTASEAPASSWRVKILAV